VKQKIFAVVCVFDGRWRPGLKLLASQVFPFTTKWAVSWHEPHAYFCP